VLLCFSLSFLVDAPVVCSALSFLAILFFVVQRSAFVAVPVSVAFFGRVILAWPVNRYGTVSTRIQMLDLGLMERMDC